MSPLAKFILGIVVVLLVLAAVPFAIEKAIRTYDRRNDAYIVRNAISTDAAPVRAGLNRRLFHEVRFPATGLSLRLRAHSLVRDEANTFAAPVRGTVRVLRLGGPSDALPGPTPPEDAPVLAEHRFRLVQIDRIALEGSLFESPDDTFEVLCRLDPAGPADTEGAEILQNGILPAGSAYEFDVTFDIPPPASNRLEVVYSKAPRSILRGTFLFPAYNALFGPVR